MSKQKIETGLALLFLMPMILVLVFAYLLVMYGFLTWVGGLVR